MTISRRREAIRFWPPVCCCWCFRRHPGRNSFRPSPRSSPKPTVSSRRAGRGHPLYVQRAISGRRSFPILDLGAENRPGHLRRQGQIGPAGKGHVQAVATRRVKPPMCGTKSNRALSTISTGCSCLFMSSGTAAPRWKTPACGNCRSETVRPSTIVVKYPSEGGSSPGDTWELYVGPDDQVHEMVFRRGGPKKPGTVIVTWADYKKAGPLLFSLDHRGTADGQPLRVFFSNVAVRLAGSGTWIDAQ